MSDLDKLMLELVKLEIKYDQMRADLHNMALKLSPGKTFWTKQCDDGYVAGYRVAKVHGNPNIKLEQTITEWGTATVACELGADIDAMYRKFCLMGLEFYPLHRSIEDAISKMKADARVKALKEIESGNTGNEGE